MKCHKADYEETEEKKIQERKRLCNLFINSYLVFIYKNIINFQLVDLKKIINILQLMIDIYYGNFKNEEKKMLNKLKAWSKIVMLIIQIWLNTTNFIFQSPPK